MNKIYYKCLSYCNSSVIGIKDVSLYYELNEYTYPVIPRSKLFVFDTLENARKSYLGDKIFECEVLGTPESPEYIADIYQVRNFWRTYIDKESPLYMAMCELPPKGTLLVDAVKITKLISEVEYD
jgi:hypothetical protein